MLKVSHAFFYFFSGPRTISCMIYTCPNGVSVQKNYLIIEFNMKTYILVILCDEKTLFHMLCWSKDILCQSYGCKKKSTTTR